MIKMMIDGQSIDFGDEVGAKHVQSLLAAMQTQLADAKRKGDDDEEEETKKKKRLAELDGSLAELKGENAALKKQLEDALAKSDAKVIDAAVKEKIDILLKADAVMEGKGDFEGKEPAEIRRTVVLAKMGDAAKDLSDAELVGAFKILTANIKPRSGTERLADSLSVLGRGGGADPGPTALRDAAYSEYCNNLTNAWKPRAAS